MQARVAVKDGETILGGNGGGEFKAFKYLGVWFDRGMRVNVQLEKGRGMGREDMQNG